MSNISLILKIFTMIKCTIPLLDQIIIKNLQFILKVAKKFGIPWYKRYKFLKKTHEFYKEGIINMKIFPRVLETLEFLKKKGNFLAILTLNSLEEINSRFLNNKEFLEQFNGNIIARDNIRYTKPSPDGIFKICTDLNIPPKNTIMVGDFLADIEAGKNAGSVTIGVLSGFSSFDMMKKNNPDFIFEDINEIPKHYDEIIANIKSKR